MKPLVSTIYTLAEETAYAEVCRRVTSDKIMVEVSKTLLQGDSLPINVRLVILGLVQPRPVWAETTR